MDARPPLRSLAFGALVFGALAACAEPAPSGEAALTEANHTAGQPTSASHAWLWANESFEEYWRVGVFPFAGGDRESLSPDHPVAMRLQFWVDRMDEALRATHGRELANAPRPQIILQNTGVPGAWVAGLDVRWEVPTRRVLTTPMPPVLDPNHRATALALKPTGMLGTDSGATLPRSHESHQLDELVRFHNAAFGSCELSLEDQGRELLFGAGCTPNRRAVPERGHAFSFRATARHVMVSTALTRAFSSEDQMVAILAHELGHFYRSHLTMPIDVLNYFYRLDQPAGGRPPPDPRFAAETTAAREKLRSEYPSATQFETENRLMLENQLGFYTIEQEADELGLELLAQVGIPASAAVDMMLTTATLIDPAQEPGGIPAAECKALREAGWKDEGGTAVTVPVGNPADAHHNTCFRVYNMTREIDAHRYALGERPTPPGDAWSLLPR
jgi:hypothetical protein